MEGGREREKEKERSRTQKGYFARIVVQVKIKLQGIIYIRIGMSDYMKI